MKNATLLLVVLLMGVHYSCSKKSDDGPNDDIPADFFAWKVDGMDREARGTNAYAFNLTDDFGVYGWPVAIGEEGCYLLIPNGTLPDTLEIGASPGVRGFYIDSTGTAYSTHLGGGGTLILQSRDNAHARGTFQFTASDGNAPSRLVTVSEGRFHVRFR